MFLSGENHELILDWGRLSRTTRNERGNEIKLLYFNCENSKNCKFEVYYKKNRGHNLVCT